MTENVIFGLPRWTGKATFTGGSWRAAYPVTNLATEPLARVARSTDATLASTQFIATLDKPRGVRALALVRHNVTLGGKMRVRLYADVARTILLYDSGWIDVWPTVYTPDQLEWEDDNWWTGKYTEEELAGTTPVRPIWLGQLYLARAIHVEIDDQSNPAGFVDVGLFEIAQGWQVSVNPSYGYQEGFRFRTEDVEALGGVKYFDRRDKPRSVRGEIQVLPRDEALARGYEALRQADLDGIFLYFPFPNEPLHWLRTVFVGRFTDPGLMSYASFQRTSYPYAIEEAL